MADIEEYLRENNSYAKAYQMMKDVMIEDRQRASQAGEEPRELKLLFSLNQKVSRTSTVIHLTYYILLCSYIFLFLSVVYRK